MGSYIHRKNNTITENQKVLSYSGNLNIYDIKDLTPTNQPTTVDGYVSKDYLAITVNASGSFVNQTYTFTANFYPFNPTARSPHNSVGIKYSIYSDASLTTLLDEYLDTSVNSGQNISENIYSFFSTVFPNSSFNVQQITNEVLYYLKAQIVDSNYAISEVVKQIGYGGSFSGSLSSFTPTLVTFPANTVTFNNFFNPYNNFDSSNPIQFTGSAYTGASPNNSLANIGTNGTNSPGVTVQNPSGVTYFQILSNNTLCPVMGNVKDSLNSTSISINSTYDFTNGVSFIIDTSQNYVVPFDDTFTMITVGGGGGSSRNYHGHIAVMYGGNGGQIQTSTITVLQNDVLEITIGTGGSSGSNGVNGSKGNNTIVVHKRGGTTLNTYTALGGGAYGDNFTQGGSLAGQSTSSRAGSNGTYGFGGAGHVYTSVHYPSGINSGTTSSSNTYYPLRATGFGAGGTCVYSQGDWGYGCTGGGAGFGSGNSNPISGNPGCVFFNNQ
tara:strand:- start:377 stop:1864 length:1488 start_codon:yes stop_codon:yes gene_type:complete